MLSRAVDGGWGWVIVGVSTFVSAVVDGVCFSAGIFFATFKQEFNASQAQTSLVSSVLDGTYLIIAPVASAYINRYGCRITAMVGGVIAALAFVGSTFSPTMEILITTYGFIAGLGFGFLYTPALVIVGYYFCRRRAIALGITCCGSGIGAMTFAPLLSLVQDRHDWKVATYMVSALLLLCVFMSLSYLPVQRSVAEKSQPVGKTNDKTVSLNSFQMQLVVRVTSSKRLLLEEQLLREVEERRATRTSNTPSTKRGPFRSFSQGDADIFAPEDSKVDFAGLSQSLPCAVDTVKPRTPYAPKSRTSVFSHSLPSNSAPVLLSSLRLSQQQKEREDASASEDYYPKSSETFWRDHDANAAYSNLNINRLSSTSAKKGCGGDVLQQKQLSFQEDQKQQQKSALPDKKSSCWESVMEPLRDNLSLLTSPSFFVYSTACFFMSLAMYVPTTFLPVLSEKLGVGASEQALLVSIIGVGNVVARLVSGLVSDRFTDISLRMNNLATVIGGVATCILPVLYTYEHLIAYAFICGASIGVFITMQVVLLIEMTGLEKMTSAFGLSNLFHGVGTLVGPPLVGYMWDKTGDISTGFYIVGALHTLAGVMCFPLHVITAWERRRVKPVQIQVPEFQTAQVQTDSNENIR